MSAAGGLTRKDYLSGIEAKWCPGCGCFPILRAVTDTFAEMNIPKEKLAVISGIGCSSRFPYYVDSYGFHTLHGRAATVATGLKLSRPDLSVWVISGDGDCLSIGGNHFMHLMRRNTDINYLLFNNNIYGLTKGQASPASAVGTVSKTTPFGSVDAPVKALSVAMASGATFAARVLDSDLKGMKETFLQAQAHKGVSFVEIFFNCVTFADKVFEDYTKKDLRDENTVRLEPGKPMIFGKESNKGLRLNGLKIEIVEIGKDGVTEADILVHDPSNSNQAYLLSQMTSPMPIGVLKEIEGLDQNSLMQTQAEAVTKRFGEGDVDQLFKGKDSWQVK